MEPGNDPGLSFALQGLELSDKQYIDNLSDYNTRFVFLLSDITYNQLGRIMSESSGRPTRRIAELEGKPPSVLARHGSTATAINARLNRPQRTPSAKPQKPDWRISLPGWLVESEPETKKSILWLKWYFYARVMFASPSIKKSHETVKVPNFIDFRAERLKNFEYVRNTRSSSGAVVTVTEAGGGVSKTTVATLLGAQRSKSCNMNVIVYDGDTSNPNVFMWYGLSTGEDWLTSESLLGYLNRGWVPSYYDMSQHCASEYDSGVLAIHARAGKSINDQSTKLILERIRPTCHSLICDTQPGTLGQDEQTSALVHSADIVIVPGLAAGAKELLSVTETLGYEPYKLRDNTGKVAKHVIIVISGVQPGEFNLRTRYLFARRYNATIEQIVLLPFSQYIKGDGNFDKINKIKIDSLDARMQYGVSVLDRTVSDLAIRLNVERQSAPLPWTEVPARPPFRAPHEQQVQFAATSTS